MSLDPDAPRRSRPPGRKRIYCGRCARYGLIKPAVTIAPRGVHLVALCQSCDDADRADRDDDSTNTTC